MKVHRASSKDLKKLVPLFNDYRIFYKQNSNQEAARLFLAERFSENDSIIFMAENASGKGIGFTQLYPSFSSVSLQRTYILNDLYVASEARKKGVGEALLKAAKQFAITEGSKGLTLETEIDNPAQSLYKKLGWVQDTKVNHYTWEIK
ncbi:GNAT family N-acetyltransferase [Jejudonia soesokkakensis]|uniref:GNAT family N-acetyltransferase n=1 Tax=Jejudonia soesokkakensis TaxID=1323432 RepID=A0ABW2MYF3_9FLAO